ncbi:MAG TPA: AIR synthase-related protein [Kiritimatiellia bacterium]|nr:AIR synthase-related protein [Kiritimatiellia bacterium]
MAFRIEIGLRKGIRDPRGTGVVRRARQFLKLSMKSCATRDVYKVGVDASSKKQREILKAFTDPVSCRSALGRLAPPPFDWMIEIGFKPGVTDNVGRTAASLVADVLDRGLSRGESIGAGIQFFLSGAQMTRTDAEAIAWNLLANPLIQTAEIFSPGEWETHPVNAEPPVMREASKASTTTIDLSGTDEDLMRISREGTLSLSLDEMRAIRDHYLNPETQTKRGNAGLPVWPTDIELECIAQTWSEHCKHKIFAADVVYRDETGVEHHYSSLYKTFIKAATAEVARERDWLVSVFTDNAGVIRFNENFHLVYKVETHNSPSALDPYGGSITGIVGVNRDPMGTGIGSELLFNTWGYCLGSPFYSGDLPEGLMHPRRIRDGVHHGVIDGGNQSGIPWVRGFERFDDRFIGKPLVFCGTVGRLPVTVNGQPSEKKHIRPGDRVVMAGGRIGKDGIHGATFSSEALHQESPAQAVQIGDPITQRKMYEFLMEARDLGLYRAITDNGAGGLSSSIGEMCQFSGGAELDLVRAPLKYPGLQPWEIFLSEAQERMSLAVPPDKLKALRDLARRRDVEISDLGEFTDDGYLTLMYDERLIGRIPLSFLHDGCPRLQLEATWTPPEAPRPRRSRVANRTSQVLKVLGALNTCSREHKSRMYDSEVKGLSVVKPFVGRQSDVPADATVCRVELSSNAGIVISEGINPFYSDIDTYWMTASVIDEAVRRIISAGGRPDTIAGLDNFCWPDPVQSEGTPDGRYKMAQLVRANQALYDICTAFKVPLISGKDSMKNDSTRGGRKISIPPTLLFSAIGRIDDVRKAVSMPFKQPGDIVYVLGRTHDELGASEYHRLLATMQGTPAHTGGNVPRLDATPAFTMYARLHDAINEGFIASSHTPTLGGLAIGFALCAVGGNLGVDIDLRRVGDEKSGDDVLLFSESNSRFIITCPPDQSGRLEQKLSDLPLYRVGVVRNDRQFNITGVRGSPVVETDIERLRKTYRATLEDI